MYRLCFEFIATIFILMGPGNALAQITTNNALPVGKDKGIVRLQYKIIRATDDPTVANRELLVQAFPIVGVYGITPRLSVFGIFPVLDKSLTLTIPQQRITRGGNIGLGDARIFSRYDIYRATSRDHILSISALGGLEVPSGRDDTKDTFGRLPQSLQLGSGSWDPFAGVVTTWQNREWFFNLSTTYQVNSKAHNFEFGDEYRLDGVVKYRLFPRELGPGVPGFFYLDLESNLIWQGKNMVSGSSDHNSGGTTWFLDPGLQYITQKFVFETIIQLPVV